MKEPCVSWGAEIMAETIRDVYGESLCELGADERIVVLDADVSSSTKSGLFGAKYPERFYNVGIAKANMMAMAAGLSSVGKIPFLNTFAVFMSTLGLCAARALVSYGRQNVKMMGAYSGLSDAYDGSSHHSYEDIAVMRTLPFVEVLVPSDALQTRWLLRYAVEKKGPMYIRLSRDAFDRVYDDNTEFTPGKGIVVRQGADATVVACGKMVAEAMKAADLLCSEGIDLRVVDLFSIKPLDTELLVQCAAETGGIVTAEEHSVIGGLGGAVAEALAKSGRPVPMEMVGMQDCFGESGPYPQLLGKYGLDARAIAGRVKRLLLRASMT